MTVDIICLTLHGCKFYTTLSKMKHELCKPRLPQQVNACLVSYTQLHSDPRWEHSAHCTESYCVNEMINTQMLLGLEMFL